MKIAINTIRLSHVVVALSATLITSIGWYVFVNNQNNQESAFQKEIASRYTDFIEYRNPVNLNTASGRQSTAVSTADSTGFSTAINLDLHACTPGAAKIRDAGGTTYFAFSGIKKVETILTSNDCVFYMGRERSGQTWDQTLNIRCEWILASASKYGYKDNILFTVDDNGIRFGDFLTNCQDLQTGRRPTQL